MFGYEKFDTISTRFLTPVTRVVEFVPRGIDGPYKVLSLSASVVPVATSVGDGYIDVNGRVDFKLVYVDLDGGINGASYNADFAVRIDGDHHSSDRCDVALSVVECQAKTASALTLSAVLKVEGIVTSVTTIEPLVEAENSFSTSKVLTLPTPAYNMTHGFFVDEETSVKDVDKILSLDTKCGLTSQKVMDKRLVLTFDTTAVVTYLEDGDIHTATFNVTSEECIDRDDVDQNDHVLALPYVKNARIVLHGVTGENVIKFEGEIGVNISANRLVEAEVIEDVFSLSYETNVTKNSFDSVAYSGENFYTERIFGQVDLPSPCALVALPTSRIVVAKTTTENGLSIEGVAYCDIIYSTDDGLSAVCAEVPFSLPIDCNFDGDIIPYATILDTAVKIKGDVAEINMLIGVQTALYGHYNGSYIAEVELGAEKEVNRSGLSMYVADEGDGLWEVCKALTATPKEINEQNPNLNFPLRFGEKVLYFRRIAK